MSAEGAADVPGDPSDGRFREAVARFEEMHREDPRSLTVEGAEVARSVHYHRRLSRWVRLLDPDPSLPLLLAAACQHVRRWTIPRDAYPEGRRGYRRWRVELAGTHVAVARAVLGDVGYGEEIVSRVEAFLLKTGLGRDAEVQLFEDAICMVFFELEYVELASRYDDAKVVEILRRTWRKMGAAGRAAALGLAEGLPERERGLVEEATAGA